MTMRSWTFCLSVFALTTLPVRGQDTIAPSRKDKGDSAIVRHTGKTYKMTVDAPDGPHVYVFKEAVVRKNGIVPVAFVEDTVWEGPFLEKVDRVPTSSPVGAAPRQPIVDIVLRGIPTTIRGVLVQRDDPWYTVDTADGRMLVNRQDIVVIRFPTP